MGNVSDRMHYEEQMGAHISRNVNLRHIFGDEPRYFRHGSHLHAGADDNDKIDFVLINVAYLVKEVVR